MYGLKSGLFGAAELLLFQEGANFFECDRLVVKISIFAAEQFGMTSAEIVIGGFGFRCSIEMDVKNLIGHLLDAEWLGGEIQDFDALLACGEQVSPKVLEPVKLVIA